MLQQIDDVFADRREDKVPRQSFYAMHVKVSVHVLHEAIGLRL